MVIINNRLSETREMNCGMNATIIYYNGCNDINIMFEDGTIVKNKTYKQFKNGSIRNENFPFTSKRGIPSNKRVGISKVMKNGMECKIIKYRNSLDIDVEFENGIIREHMRYDHFVEGKIGLRRPNNGSISFGEKAIINYFDMFNIQYCFNVTMPNVCKTLNIKLVYDYTERNLRFDFITKINDNIYIIEYDGEQHNGDVKFFNSSYSYEKQKDNDLRKERIAKINKCVFIRINGYTDILVKMRSIMLEVA